MINQLRALVLPILSLGVDPEDSEEVRLRKILLVGGSTFILLAAFPWGLVYLYFGELWVGVVNLVYIAITALTLVAFSKSRRYQFLRFSQLAFGLLLPLLWTIILGGYVGSSGVILWSLTSPMGALLFYDSRRALRWVAVYFLVTLLSGLIAPLIQGSNNLPGSLIAIFFVLNLVGVSTVVILFFKYFIDQREKAYRLLHLEEQKAENLLLNILPREIAAILKNENRTIADQFEGASILFADLVGFTPLTAVLAPVEMVELLNEVFSHFDALVEKYDVEKIRTIGDNYMVAAGVPRPRPDHAEALARMALDMRAYLDSRPNTNGRQVEFRIGINSGPVIGGVIGRKKFVYDLWGDAVNTASRMESQGVPGKIQITETTYDLIKEEFVCEPRGVMQVKGKGEMRTWFLVGENSKT
jgi:guanylate cyclase